MMLLSLPPVGVTPKISHFLGLCCYTISHDRLVPCSTSNIGTLSHTYHTATGSKQDKGRALYRGGADCVTSLGGSDVEACRPSQKGKSAECVCNSLNTEILRINGIN